MESTATPAPQRARLGNLSLGAAAIALCIVLSIFLRRSSFAADPLLDGVLQLSSAVLAFTFTACALVRFRGTRDRAALVLAFAFALSGALATSSSIQFLRQGVFAAEPEPAKNPAAWGLSGILLASLLLLSLAASRSSSGVRRPGREIAAALFLVAVASYGVGWLNARLPMEWVTLQAGIFPRPLNLVAAAIFSAAAIGFARRLARTGTAFDSGLRNAAWLSVGCYLAAAQSGRFHDAAFTLSQLLLVASYAVALGGALVDYGRVFDRVQQLASSDPLTGLGNYRRLLDALERELQRSGRTGRPFAVVLLDLDGLKHLNDRYGHLVGSQALCRLANVLRSNCRAIDTAARYGGFALILPETDEHAAQEVAARICERLTSDQLGPRLSVSVGVAIYPQAGAKIEQLLAGADEALYAMKTERKNKTSSASAASTGWLFER